MTPVSRGHSTSVCCTELAMRLVALAMRPEDHASTRCLDALPDHSASVVTVTPGRLTPAVVSRTNPEPEWADLDTAWVNVHLSGGRCQSRRKSECGGANDEKSPHDALLLGCPENNTREQS